MAPFAVAPKSIARELGHDPINRSDRETDALKQPKLALKKSAASSAFAALADY